MHRLLKLPPTNFRIVWTKNTQNPCDIAPLNKVRQSKLIAIDVIHPEGIIYFITRVSTKPRFLTNF